MKKIAFVSGWYTLGPQQGINEENSFVLESLYKSAKKYFFPNHDVEFIFITNDKSIELEGITNIKIDHPIEGFWHMCLMKILALKYLEDKYDYIFVNDTDQIFVDYVNEDLLNHDMTLLEHYYYPLVKSIHEEVTDTVELNFDTAKERWTLGNFFGGKSEVIKGLVTNSENWHETYKQHPYSPHIHFYTRYPEELFLIKYVFENNIEHKRLIARGTPQEAEEVNFLCDFQDNIEVYDNLKHVVMFHNTKKNVEVLKKVIHKYSHPEIKVKRPTTVSNVATTSIDNIPSKRPSGPIGKVVVAQFYTDNVSYGQFAEKINRDYCQEKGYEYYCEKDTVKIRTSLRDKAPTWYKPTLVLEVLETYNPDYVLFLDIDAIVSDTNQRVEDFIDENYDIIFAEDVGHHSAMNAGVFILKNTEWSKKFLQEWADSAETTKGKDARDLEVNLENRERAGYFKNALWHDQTCLTYLYESREDIRNKIKVISNVSLNGREYNKGNFIFHAYAYGHLGNRSLDGIYKEKYKEKVDLPEIKLIVYHIFCVNNYLEIVKQQLDRVKASGLYDWCDKMEVTCINKEGNFEDIEKLLKDYSKITLNKFINNDCEHEAIQKVWEYSQKYKGKVFYFHTKGVANNFKNVNSTEQSEWKKKGVSWWKEIMEYYLIDNYKDCVDKLDRYDQCGVTLKNRWWWGNFWWSTLDYINLNNAPAHGDRWYYEAWLNSTRDPSHHEYYHFDFNAYYTILPNDIYSNREKYRNSIMEVTEAYYGTLGEHQNENEGTVERVVVDVTEKVKANLAEHNNKGFNIRVDNDLAGDPYYGVHKVLEIHFLLEGEKYILVVAEGQTLNFQL